MNARYEKADEIGGWRNTVDIGYGGLEFEAVV